MIPLLVELFDRRWGDCRLCQMLRNPFYAPAGYLARLSVNIATFIWATIILVNEGALDGRRWYVYHQMLAVMPEDAWALLAMLLVGIGIWRLIAHARPTWWGAFGYLVLMVFWVYLAASLFTNPLVPAASPASTSAITVVAFLSIYAAASNARYTQPLPPAGNG